MNRLCLLFLLLAPASRAQPAWQEEFARMPLVEKVSELDRHNCVRVVLNSFRSNSAVQALVFMPGATDEFYFFRRAHAKLTNDAPSLLDAIVALTNQTYIRATLNPPFLLLHTTEDTLEPIIVVEDARMAERVKRKRFEKHAVFDDSDWDFVEPILAFDINTRLTPRLHSHDSYHFFRHSLAEYDLSGWDALRAVALADKTRITVKKRWIAFEGDTRHAAEPAHLNDFVPEAGGGGR